MGSISVTSAGAVMVNDATVTGTDILVMNGVVHTIDKVLMPPAGTTMAPEGNSTVPSVGTTMAPEGNSTVPSVGTTMAPEGNSTVPSVGTTAAPSENTTVPSTITTTAAADGTEEPIATGAQGLDFGMTTAVCYLMAVMAFH